MWKTETEIIEDEKKILSVFFFVPFIAGLAVGHSHQSSDLYDSHSITPVVMNCYCSFKVTCQKMIEVECNCAVTVLVCVPTYIH